MPPKFHLKNDHAEGRGRSLSTTEQSTTLPHSVTSMEALSTKTSRASLTSYDTLSIQLRVIPSLEKQVQRMANCDIKWHPQSGRKCKLQVTSPLRTFRGASCAVSCFVSNGVCTGYKTERRNCRNKTKNDFLGVEGFCLLCVFSPCPCIRNSL